MTEALQNGFSIDEYRSVLKHAKYHGYDVVTLRRFVELGCPNIGKLVLRHDLDRTPKSLERMLDAEVAEGVTSTVFFRCAGAEYNPLGYQCIASIKRMVKSGFEVGLHTNCVEFGTITDSDPNEVLRIELGALRQFADVVGIAPHRDINYMYNTLPWLERLWDAISSEHKLEYHSYEPRIIEATIYIAETFSPHLCWRNDPYAALETGRSVYMLTHPHWWYTTHAFEDQP